MKMTENFTKLKFRPHKFRKIDSFIISRQINKIEVLRLIPSVDSAFGSC